MGSHQPSAVFTFSTRDAVVLDVTYFFFTLSVGIYYLLTQPFGFVGMLAFSLASLGFLAGAFRYRRLEVTSAWFYEDRFRIRGRRHEKILNYSDIQKVPKVRVFPFLTPPTQVHILVKGSERPLVIATVPKNRKLKLDLYSWLTQKTRQT